MKFEIGKYYRHTTGLEFAIVGEVTTTLRGTGLVAETNGKEEITMVGKEESHAENFEEISKEDWMKNFN